MREALPLCFALKHIDRLKGLFAYREEEVLLVIAPCKSIHTYGLQRAINVAFIDRKGFVIVSHTHVPPFRLLHSRKAYGVIECWSKEEDDWYEEGDRIVVLKGW